MLYLILKVKHFQNLIESNPLFQFYFVFFSAPVIYTLPVSMMVHAAGLHRLISEPSIISRSIIQHRPIRLCGEIEKARVMKNKWLSQTSKLIGPLFIFLLCLLDCLSLPAIHFYGNFHRSVATCDFAEKSKLNNT